jgi:propionyl-CoA synthetase
MTRIQRRMAEGLDVVTEGRDPGDLTTMEDPTALQQIRDLM